MVKRFTEEGFLKKKLPIDIWNIIKKEFGNGTQVPEYVENDKNGLDHWLSSDKHRIATDKIEYSAESKRLILEKIKPHLEEWCGDKLKGGILYHIRRYKDGAKLPLHRDNEPTHHVGANITIDIDGEPWEFEIKDHEGNLHKILIEPGEVVFYEASRLEHGRPSPFSGNFYTNTFVHFQLDE